MLCTRVCHAAPRAPPDCVYEADSAGLENFYDAAEVHGCNYKSYRPECVKDVANVTATTFQDFSPCRGVIHFDAVFIVASALGVLSEYAYWLAAYSQAVDFVQFEAVDSCGKKLAPAFWTPPLRGLMRTSAPTVRENIYKLPPDFFYQFF